MAGARATPFAVVTISFCILLCIGLIALFVFLESRPAEALWQSALLGWTLTASIALTLAFGFLALNRHRAVVSAREAEASFRELYDNISEGVFRSTLDGRMISANPSLVRLNGYETEQQLLDGCDNIATEWYVDSNRRAEIHEMLLKGDRVTGLVSEVYRHKTRERIWIEESVRLVRDKWTGRPLYYDGTLREVTETMRRLELQDRYNKIASVVSACLYQHRATPDGASSMPYASIGLYHIFGVHPEAVANDASVLASLIHPDDLDRITASLRHSSETLTVWQCEYRVLRPDGTQKWVFAHSMPEREADGSTLWHGYIMDISERKQSEARIYELAYFDQLTHLPNRTTLRDRLRQVLTREAGNRRYAALLFVDLDHFKMLNDTKGHHVGDLLLCQVAGRIRAHVRQDDLVARLGGDEFVVLLDNLSSDASSATASVQAVSEAILAAIDQPFQLDEDMFQTTASLGAVLLGADERDVDDVLKRADLAMYEAKAAGRGTVRFFREAMQVAAADRMALTSDLRRAHAEAKLTLHYQPLIESSGRCFGAEALLRWSHPTRGPITPAEFIPLAERSGFMGSIDKWVLRTACATLREWALDPLTRDLQLAVNVSAGQLNGPGFVEFVDETLRETGANPRRLALELTEHAMLDDIEAVGGSMLMLKAMGVRLSLDDFGTGYSSLSYLKRLPIDTLKIDGSFVSDIEGDQSGRAIVQSILNIARNLDVSVIAEGVETEMQAILLRQFGCHSFQGYFFAKPMPLEDFRAYLAEDAARTRDEAERPRLHAIS
jgi:diguanylate cyclase (GGDEF)-like protein/PAS domain S-box-containing protein